MEDLNEDENDRCITAERCYKGFNLIPVGEKVIQISRFLPQGNPIDIPQEGHRYDNDDDWDFVSSDKRACGHDAFEGDASSAATAGSALPSNRARKAPPPVDM